MSPSTTFVERPARPRLEGVTFDFWNTLFQPGPVLPARLLQATAFLRERGSGLSDREIENHFHAAQKRNDELWRGGEHFGGMGVARYLLEAGLDRSDEAAALQLNQRFQEPADPDQPIRPGAGVAAALATLAAAGCRLGIVSVDTGYW